MSKALLAQIGLSVVLCGSVQGSVAVQDMFVFENLEVYSAGAWVDLAPSLVAGSLGSPGAAVNFPGGAVFTTTTSFPGLARDVDNVVLGNTTVTPGVLSYGGNHLFSLITSSEVSTVKETIGVSDAVQFAVTSILPSDVRVGDVGRMDYAFMQLLKPAEMTSEAELSDVQIAADRAALGLLRVPSLDGATMIEAFDQPFVIDSGSKWLKFIGKGLVIIGGTAGGAVGGAAVGTVTLPVIGTVSGTVLGTIGGFSASAGAMLIENNKDDVTPDKPLPTASNGMPNLVPSVVPEPCTIQLLTLGLAGFVVRRGR